MLKLAFPIALFILSGNFLTAAEKPNVIIVFADDMGIDSVQAYNPTFQAPTPHLDQLSRDAESFMDAHTPSSVCSPTRYALLTGRYPWRGVLKNGVLRPYEPSAIEKERLTLPKILKGLGYDTACIGKWHLGYCHPDYLPNNRGFQTAFGQWTHFVNYYTRQAGEGNEQVEKVSNPTLGSVSASLQIP